jgi:hypothetical protein
MMVLALVGGALTVMGPWAPRVDLNLFGPGHAQAHKIAAQSQASQRWFTIAADWDSALTWPQGQTIALVLKDGRNLEAVQILAMTPRPQMRPIFLGLVSRTLYPSELEHGKNGRCVLLVAFPDPDLGLRDIAGVQVRQKGAGAAPPPGGGVP